MRAVLISIQPKWCELIASGKKTVEVRKTKPKIETPFKCYIYCTQPKKLFRFSSFGYSSDEYLWLANGKVEMNDGFKYWHGYEDYKKLNGKVIGEFVCDKVVEFECDFNEPAFCETADLSCVGLEALWGYCIKKGKGYGWHITDLVVYDEPRELSEFYVEGDCDCMNCKNCYWFDNGNGYNVEDDCNLAYKAVGTRKSFKPLFRPPQSWCYVEERSKENSERIESV